MPRPGDTTCECLGNVQVTVRFPGRSDPRAFDRARFRMSLALLLGVDPALVVVTDVRAGSVIVDFVVLPPPGERAVAAATVAAIKAKVETGHPSLEEEFGVWEVTRFEEAPNPQAEPSQGADWAVPAGVGAGSALVIVATALLLRRWRRAKASSQVTQVESGAGDVERGPDGTLPGPLPRMVELVGPRAPPPNGLRPALAPLPDAAQTEAEQMELAMALSQMPDQQRGPGPGYPPPGKAVPALDAAQREAEQMELALALSQVEQRHQGPEAAGRLQGLMPDSEEAERAQLELAMALSRGDARAGNDGVPPTV